MCRRPSREPGGLGYVAVGGDPDDVAIAEAAGQRRQFRRRRLAGGLEQLLGMQAADHVVVSAGIPTAHAVVEHRARVLTDLVDGSALSGQSLAGQVRVIADLHELEDMETRRGYAG